MSECYIVATIFNDFMVEKVNTFRNKHNAIENAKEWVEHYIDNEVNVPHAICVYDCQMAEIIFWDNFSNVSRETYYYDTDNASEAISWINEFPEYLHKVLKFMLIQWCRRKTPGDVVVMTLRKLFEIYEVDRVKCEEIINNLFEKEAVRIYNEI